MVDLIYPPLCAGCGYLRPLDQHIFCLECLHQLPETGFHMHVDNPFTRHFAGRIPIQTGAAFLYFTRGGATQRLLHQVKYHNRPDLITVLGRWYGKQLIKSPYWNGLEVTVPVPLHWKKFRKRGYNQSAVFSQSIADVMGLRCYPYALKRTTHDKSLTGMNRFQRIETIGASFIAAKPQLLKNKNVLLVDDVLTTGATLEACGLAMQTIPIASLRMVTIACGEL